MNGDNGLHRRHDSIGSLSRPAIGFDATDRRADTETYVQAVTRAQQHGAHILVAGDATDTQLFTRLRSLDVTLIELSEETRCNPNQKLCTASKELGLPGVLIHPSPPDADIAYAESHKALLQTDEYAIRARVSTDQHSPDVIAGIPVLADMAEIGHVVDQVHEYVDTVLVVGDTEFSTRSALANRPEVVTIEADGTTEAATIQTLFSHIEQHYADFDALHLVTAPDQQALPSIPTLTDTLTTDDADLVVGQSEGQNTSGSDSIYQRLKRTLRDEFVFGSAVEAETPLQPSVLALSPTAVSQLAVDTDSDAIATHLLETAIAADLTVSVTEAGSARTPESESPPAEAPRPASTSGHQVVEDSGHAVTDDSAVAPPSEVSPESFIVGVESDTSPILSVVIPTMNEEEGIEPCLEWVHEAIGELQVPTEIIISDSSTDRTPELARQHGAIVIEPDEPGYGYAYRYAFNRARGEYIVMGDADTTYDFSEIPRLIEHLEATDADMVMGSRLNGDIKPGAMPPLHKYIGNPLLTRFLNTFYDAGVNDAHSGFRVLTADALAQLDLTTTGMEFASEMIMAATEAGLTIEEVPITYHERKGEETLDSFHDGWRHVRFMLVNAPQYLFTVPALGLSGLGVLTLILSGLGVTVGELTFSVHTAIAGGLLLITGYQIGTLGIFSAITGDPIRTPTDRVTQWVQEHVRLEHGIGVGLGATLLGGIYSALMIGQWLATGQVPLVVPNLLAFTAIVIGLQTIFYAFFLSILSEGVSE